MNKTNKKIIFWGTPEFSVPYLNSLIKLDLVKAVVTQADKPAGRRRQLQASPVKELAQAKGVDVLDYPQLDKEFIAKLKTYLPATFVIVAYGKILAQEILELSELPAINIHPSQLPILRGPAPIQWALKLGLETTAVSLMQLDDKMDHGPILAQQELKIEPNDNYYTLITKINEIGVKMLEDNIFNYLENKIVAQPQDDSQATTCSLIKKEDGQINWFDSATNINNQIRAFVDWPGSFSKLKDLDIKILEAKVIEETNSPGLFKIEDNKLIVGTGDKSLEIIKIQPAGKKAMTVAEFIKGYNRYI